MIFLFFREQDGEEFFYPIEIPESIIQGGAPLESIAAEHAALNPGTLKVETINGQCLWGAQLC